MTGHEKGSLLNAAGSCISLRKLQRASILILLFVLGAVASAKSPTFLTWYNLVDNLFTNAAAIGIIAVGMTFVMIAGGFDLSVAANTAVCSIVLVLTINALSPCGPVAAVIVALLLTAIVGIALGAINGTLVAYVGVNPFVVTLSTMFVFRGFGLILTHGGQSMQIASLTLRRQFTDWLYDSKCPFFGAECQISMPIIVFIVLFVIGFYLLKMTRFGHYVYAIGGNEEAAWLAGVNTKLIKACTYMLCGLTCAVAGALFLANATTAEAAGHAGKELDVIAAVIVGGTPLGGGSGGLVLTLIGLILLKVIENLLTQFNVGAEYRPVVTGLIIMVVVTIDVLVNKKTRQ
ncbi:MAG: ABC transporter permease [Planctomycetota bacterium]